MEDDRQISRDPFEEAAYRLRSLEPQRVAELTLVSLEDSRFLIPCLRWQIEVSFPSLEFTMPPFLKTFGLRLLTLLYLANASESRSAQEWVPYRELKDGLFYSKNFSETMESRIASRFGGDLEAFSKSALELGGRPVDQGDAAFAFRMFPALPILVILWSDSEEFPADCRILFDRAATDRLSVFDLKMLSGELLSLLFKVSEGRVDLAEQG